MHSAHNQPDLPHPYLPLGPTHNCHHPPHYGAGAYKLKQATLQPGRPHPTAPKDTAGAFTTLHQRIRLAGTAQIHPTLGVCVLQFSTAVLLRFQYP
jgi:hypothetical protein